MRSALAFIIGFIIRDLFRPRERPEDTGDTSPEEESESYSATSSPESQRTSSQATGDTASEREETMHRSTLAAILWVGVIVIIIIAAVAIVRSVTDDGGNANERLMTLIEEEDFNSIDNFLEDEGVDEDDVEDLEEAFDNLIDNAEAQGFDDSDIADALADAVEDNVDLDDELDVDDIMDAIEDAQVELVMNANNDMDQSPTSNSNQSSVAANMFGGNAENWEVDVPGHSWKYTGPPTEITIPEGYRADWENHTCETPGSTGTYGAAQITSGDVTIWHVPGETSCPDTAASNPNSGSNNSKPAQDNSNNNPAPSNNDSQPSTNSGGSNSQPSSSADTVEECISTTEMNQLTNTNVQRVGGEACAYTLRVAAIGSDDNITCPEDLICTLTQEDTHVFMGDNNASYDGVIAGTARYKPAYPLTDAVHDACRLTAKEHAFGQQQNPPFPVTPGNFSCENGEAVMSNSGDQNDNSSETCPESPSDAAALVGGSSSNWEVVPGSDDTGWKYGPNAPSVHLTAPSFGRIDYSNGALRNGQSAAATEATLWCNG